MSKTKNSKRVQKIINLYKELEELCDNNSMGVMAHHFKRSEFNDDDWKECDSPRSMDYKGNPNLVLFLKKE